MYRKHGKKPSCRNENKGSNSSSSQLVTNFTYEIFLGGLLFDCKYSVFE